MFSFYRLQDKDADRHGTKAWPRSHHPADDQENTLLDTLIEWSVKGERYVDIGGRGNQTTFYLELGSFADKHLPSAEALEQKIALASDKRTFFGLSKEMPRPLKSACKLLSSHDRSEPGDHSVSALGSRPRGPLAPLEHHTDAQTGTARHSRS